MQGVQVEDNSDRTGPEVNHCPDHYGSEEGPRGTSDDMKGSMQGIQYMRLRSIFNR